MRPTIVAGSFYEISFTKLENQIKDLFEKGPGSLPMKKREKNIFAAIAPHAGYFFSGTCQAWVYKELAESKFPKVYVILGTNHTSNHNVINYEDWETPFGIVKNAKINLNIREDDMRQEHSIEVQLPFLQFINKDYFKELKILPILTSYYDEELCKKIAKIENFNLIVSSDFTHYGPNYGYTPFIYNKKESLYALDKKAIDFILKLDLDNFLKYTKDKTICGKAAIANMIKICQLLNKTKTRLVSYYTSGDIVNDYTNAVGYGGIIVEG